MKYEEFCPTCDRVQEFEIVPSTRHRTIEAVGAELSKSAAVHSSVLSLFIKVGTLVVNATRDTSRDRIQAKCRVCGRLHH